MKREGAGASSCPGACFRTKEQTVIIHVEEYTPPHSHRRRGGSPGTFIFYMTLKPKHYTNITNMQLCW